MRNRQKDKLLSSHLSQATSIHPGWVLLPSLLTVCFLTPEGLYASSKRAIEVVADTLRVELAPLGVTVLTVVTGGVQSAGQTYFDDLKLPENSRYKSVEDTIVSRAKGGDGMPRMDTVEYAKAVVDEIEKGKSGKFWYGEFAEMVRQSTTAVGVPVEAMVSLVFVWCGV